MLNPPEYVIAKDKFRVRHRLKLVKSLIKKIFGLYRISLKTNSYVLNRLQKLPLSDEWKTAGAYPQKKGDPNFLPLIISVVASEAVAAQ